MHNILINSSREHWESLNGPPDGTADAPISLTPTGPRFVLDNPASFVLNSEVTKALRLRDEVGNQMGHTRRGYQARLL